MAVSNSEFRSLELQCFETLLNVHPIELRASFLRSGHIGTCWCRSRSPQTGVAFACPSRASSETGVAFARPSRASDETAIAFARPSRASDETAVAFARPCRASSETGIAFAGEKKLFLARFSGAEVSSVSRVPVQGRALVMVVSCWSASVVAEVSVVSMSPRHSCLCAKKFALRGLMWGCARKSSPCVLKMAQNGRFVACRAKFFAVERERARCRAKFFAEMPVEAPCRANFFAVEHEGTRCRANFFAELLRNGRVGRSLSRGRAHWSAAAGRCCLDLGCTMPPRSRAYTATYM